MTQQTVKLICLANSFKHGGRCVAGLVLGGTSWLRPVSATHDGTLQPQHYRLTSGAEPKLLDVIEIDVSTAAPRPHQPENWTIAGTAWRLAGTIAGPQALAALTPALVPGPALLGDRSDRVAFASFSPNPAAASLALIEPRQISWVVTANFKGNRQVRCQFELNGEWYSLSITDPLFLNRVAQLPMGTHPRDAAAIPANSRVFLTVSLGEPFPENPPGNCFKLVAAVLVVP